VKPTTIRLSDDLLNSLDAEADAYGFQSRTEYVRFLLEHREVVVESELEEGRSTVADLADRLEELEQRVAALNVEGSSTTPTVKGGKRMDDDEDPGELDLGGDTGEPDGGEAAVDDDDDTPSGDGPDDADEETSAGDENAVSVDDFEFNDIEEPEEHIELRDPGPEDIRHRVHRLDLVGPTEEIRSDREASVAAAWLTLVDTGEMDAEALEEEVFPENPGSFSSEESWYRRLIVPAFEQLDDVELVGDGTWRYVGQGTVD